MSGGRLALRVALLTNFVPPYRAPLYRALAHRVEAFRVLVSTPMEPNRSWDADWGELDVVTQRSVMLRRTWRHPQGFRDDVYVHLPYDTMKQLSRFRPDVVISSEFGARSLLAMLYGGARHTPVVLWATLSDHTEQGRGGARHALRRWMLPRAAAVLVNGAGGARYIRRFGVAPSRIFRVPTTVDVAPFVSLPLARPGEAKRLLFAGQITERKGLAPFLAVLERWARRHKDDHVEFLVAGDGPLRASMERAELPGNLVVRWLGDVSYDALPQVYRDASLFVFPSLADEWGVVVNEAMAAGLPVLGSVYAQAVEELVGRGRTGWTFTPDDPDDALAALDTALSTPPDALAAMGSAAREVARQLTPDAVATRIVEAVRSVA